MKPLNSIITKKNIVISVIILIVFSFSIISINTYKLKVEANKLESITLSKDDIKNNFNSLPYKKPYESNYSDLLLELEKKLSLGEIQDSEILVEDLESIYSEALKYSKDVTKLKNNVDFDTISLETTYVPEFYKPEIKEILNEINTLISNEEIEAYNSKYKELYKLYEVYNKGFIESLEHSNIKFSERLESILTKEYYNDLISMDPTIAKDIEVIKGDIESFKNARIALKPEKNKLFEGSVYTDFEKLKESIDKNINNVSENKIPKILPDIMGEKKDIAKNKIIKLTQNNGFNFENIIKSFLHQIEDEKIRTIEVLSTYHLTSTLSSPNGDMVRYHFEFSYAEFTPTSISYSYECYKERNDRFSDNPKEFLNYKLDNEGKITYNVDGTVYLDDFKYENTLPKYTIDFK